MKYILKIILTIQVGITFGQNITTWSLDSLAVLLANDLIESNQTNEVLIFQNGCIGCEVGNADCECFDGYSLVYLIWAADGKIWSTRINCCLKTEKNEFPNQKLWNEFEMHRQNIFTSRFKADVDWSHYGFWYLRSMPNHPQRLQIFDYYLDDDSPYQANNREQAANQFRQKLQESLNEVWK